MTTSPVLSKPPRNRIIASCFLNASANVASLLLPTMYCLNVPNFRAFFNSSANSTFIKHLNKNRKKNHIPYMNIKINYITHTHRFSFLAQFTIIFTYNYSDPQNRHSSYMHVYSKYLLCD